MSGNMTNIKRQNQPKIRLTPNIKLEQGEIVDLYTNGQAIGVFKGGQHIDTIYNQQALGIFARRNMFKGVMVEDGIKFIRYAQLHDHSYFSLLDGMVSPEDKAKFSEYYAALTDHGNMFGYNRFDKAMRKLGKHPILGCEVYCEQLDTKEHARNHLVLLAENSTGLENIIKICTNAWDNIHKRPHVTWDDLKLYSEGVICLTACAGGEIPRHLIKGDYESALKTTQALITIFGHSNVYLEVQRHNMAEDEIVIEGMKRLSQDTGLKIVATTDSHYIRKEDSYHHEIQLCIRTGAKITDEKRFKFPGEGYYIHSSDEMVEIYADNLEWLDNTLDLAERCDATVKRGEYILPEFPLPEGFDNQGQYLEYLCREGFKWRFANTPKFNDARYHERLKYELDVILNMGFPGYFVIVSDFIMYSKRKGILVGPGRGSAAGSLVAYVTGITDIDPIEYNLLFERFLNPDRISMPDIDIDFQDDRRDEVIEYVKGKYGEDNVSKIVTFGTLAAKVSIRDVTRAIIEDKDEVTATANRICKTIPNKQGVTLKTALEESPEFRKMYEEESKVREIVDIARMMEGMPRQTGVHACGLLISPEQVKEYIPQIRMQNKKTKQYDKVTQLTMSECEELGLLKVDFLGLRTLGVVSEALRLINKREDIQQTLTFDMIPIEDVAVYESLSQGNTAGCFQLESDGMTNLMKEMYQDIDKLKHRPGAGRECFERLVAGLSLYRPGPIDEIPNYIRCMLNPEEIRYEIPQLEKHLKNTYSVITYQEQVMAIVRDLAGFSAGDADVVRKGMGKKKQEIIDEYGQYFVYGNAEKNIPGCVNQGILEQPAIDLWAKMAKFGAYAFNRSHAACYAVIAAKTAWLAHYYPVEYMTAILNSYLQKAEKIRAYMAKCSQQGIRILPPDINYSAINFDVEGDGIRFGLKGLKNVGASSIQIIEERQKNGLYASYTELAKRLSAYQNVNKSVYESLIYSGAMDGFNGTRSAKLNVMEKMMELSKKEKERRKTGRVSLLDWMIENKADEIQGFNDFFEVKVDDLEEMEKGLKLEKEYEVAGFYITEHPIDRFAHVLMKEYTHAISLLLEGDDEEEDGVTVFADANKTSDDVEELMDGSEDKLADGDFVKIAGIIKEFKIMYSKKDNSPFAVFKLEDRSGIVKVVVFSKDYGRYKDLIGDGKIVKINGRFRKTDFGVEVHGTKVEDLERYETQNALNRVDVRSVADLDTARQQYIALLSLVKSSPGEIPVYFHNQANGMIYELPERLHSTNQVLEQINVIFGMDNIAFS